MGGKVCHCGRVFTTGQGLQLHKAKVHGEFAPEHAFVTGATCTVCKRYFWSSQGLQQHLAYIPRGGRGGAYNRCYAELVRRGGDPNQFARVVPPKSSNGWNRRDALPVEGPDWLPPSAAQMEVQVLKQQLDQALMELQTFGLDVAPEENFQTAFMEELTHQTRTWFDSFDPDTPPHVARGQLQDAWISALDNVTPEGALSLPRGFLLALESWGQRVLPDIMAEWVDGYAEVYADSAFAEIPTGLDGYSSLLQYRALEQRYYDAVSKIEQVATPKPHRLPKNSQAPANTSGKKMVPIQSHFASQDAWIRGLRQTECVQHPELPDTAPRLKTVDDKPHFVVVHLFSGRRRDSDFHAHLHRLFAHIDAQLTVLSLDTAVSKQFGDLTVGSETWKNLVPLYEKGLVCATLVGAPCETWSEARHTEAPEDDKTGRIWPRPLRSHDRPWGLLGLSNKELRQLQQGSQLHLSSLWLCLHHLRCGGLFMSEHPWMPKRSERASSWRTPLMGLVCGLPRIKLWCIH